MHLKHIAVQNICGQCKSRSRKRTQVKDRRVSGLLWAADRRANMVVAEQQQLADNTVNFQRRHKQILEWIYTLMSKRFIKIHPSLQQLIVSLRTAVVIDDWKLDKYQTSHYAILDSFRLACLNYKIPRTA